MRLIDADELLIMFVGSKFCPNCGARMDYETEKV